MDNKDYFKGLNLAITISAKDGEILYQNDSSIEVNGDARGRDLMKCHNERSQQIIRHLLDDAATNVYTIDAALRQGITKKGRRGALFCSSGFTSSRGYKYPEQSQTPRQ